MELVSNYQLAMLTTAATVAFINLFILSPLLDPTSMVQQYLAHGQVALRNAEHETFATSINVFVNGRQTPGPLPSAQALLVYSTLLRDFERIQDQFAENKKLLQQSQDANKRYRTAPFMLSSNAALSDFAVTNCGLNDRNASGERIRRHKSSQRFNRYRTIDRPATQDVQAVTETNKTITASTSTLSKKKTPQERPRYSFKKRTRRIQHEPPEKMVQYAWKPWKKAPENPLDPNSDVLKKEREVKRRKGKKTIPKPVNDSTGKADLVRFMAWEHPTVTLDVGTVSANLKRALGDSELVPEINKCLQDVVRLASDAKRQSQ